MATTFIGNLKVTKDLQKLLKMMPKNKQVYVSHGWIDSHVHFAKSGLFNTSPKTIEQQSGVVGFIDAGTAGYLDAGSEAEHIENVQKVNKVLSNRLFWRFVNVAKHGLQTKQELKKIDFDWPMFSESLKVNGVLGAKVRASSGPVAGNETEFFEVCDTLKKNRVKTMFHIGNEPPSFLKLAAFIKTEDIVTHFYHGKNETLLKHFESNKPRFYIDVGWGAESFDHVTYEKMHKRSILPTSISTDMHESLKPARKNALALLMSHFLEKGMSLEGVIDCVTMNPYENYLGREYREYLKTFTVFEIIDNTNSESLYDSKNHRFTPKKIIRPVAMLGPKEQEWYFD